ncbi:MAG: 50S ribosomal protein L9 [Clostridiales Family XIII bacterium]|jgi:large subunit ribosomal protein L9|nr:50S ribosomal protein L9 [Clostridiales Family XIII bacterium]
MQVILMEDLAGKGAAGDVIKVANGYARNYLLPRGIAITATESNLKTLEHRRTKLAERKEQDKAAAEEIAAKIDSTSITLEGKSGKGGRLFGSITTQDIVNEINKVHGIYIDKRKVQLEAAIKQVGVHPVTVRLHAEVIPTVRVLVGTPEEIAAAEEAARVAAEKAAARAAAEAEAKARAEAEAAAAAAAADAASDRDDEYGYDSYDRQDRYDRYDEDGDGSYADADAGRYDDGGYADAAGSPAADAADEAVAADDAADDESYDAAAPYEKYDEE